MSARRLTPAALRGLTLVAFFTGLSDVKLVFDRFNQAFLFYQTTCLNSSFYQLIGSAILFLLPFPGLQASFHATLSPHDNRSLLSLLPFKRRHATSAAYYCMVLLLGQFRHPITIHYTTLHRSSRSSRHFFASTSVSP